MRRLLLVLTAAALLAALAPGAAARAATGPDVTTMSVGTAPASRLLPDGTRTLVVSGRTSTPACRVTLEQHDPAQWWAPYTLVRAKVQAASRSYRFTQTVGSGSALFGVDYRVTAAACDGTTGRSASRTSLGFEAVDDASPGLTWLPGTSTTTSPAAYAGGYRTVTGPGGSMSVRGFRAAQALSLYAHVGPDGGLADVYVDGTAAGTVSFWAATPREAVQRWQRALPADTGTGHELRVVLRAPGAGGGTVLAVDAFVVREVVFVGA